MIIIYILNKIKIRFQRNIKADKGKYVKKDL